MQTIQQCSICGRPLAPGTVLGFCPACVLGQHLSFCKRVADSTDRFFADPAQLHATPEDPERYVDAREHARGGIGRILLAQDAQLGREIVIKELLPETEEEMAAAGTTPGPARGTTSQAVRFVREARITGQLEHPSIVPVYELGYRADGTLYYTMKHVRGTSLWDALRKADSLDARLGLLPHYLDLCQAIAYAHSRGVIHRDIKPHNVMVGEFGETVVLDWGLAKSRSQGSEEWEEIDTSELTAASSDLRLSGETTLHGQVLGTPAYMAPEQAQGSADVVDERSDVYALGAVLYVVLTGQAPFSGDNRDMLIRRAATESPVSVRTIEPKAPVELAAVCRKAMARKRDERYAAAADLAREIQHYLTGAQVSAHRYGVAEHARRFARRHKSLLGTACAAAVAMLVLAGSSYVRIVSERDSAVAAKENAQASVRLAQRAVDVLLTEVSENDLINRPQMESVRRKLLESALAFCQEIARQRPANDANSMAATAEALRQLGDVYELLGRNENAIIVYQQARRVYDTLTLAHPELAEHRFARAHVLLGLGRVCLSLGRYDVACASQEAAILAMDALVEAYPESADYQEAAALARNNLGAVYDALGRNEEALAVYEKAAEGLTELLTYHPLLATPGCQKVLALTLVSAGKLHIFALGRFGEAETLLEKAEDLTSALVEAHPEQPEFKNVLAEARNMLGVVRIKMYRAEDALELCGQARQLLDELVQAHPDVPKYRDALADAWQNLGVGYANLKRYDEALAAAMQVRQLREGLVQAHRDVPEYRAGLAEACFIVGFSYLHLNRNEEGLAAYDEARAHYEDLVDENAALPRYINGLAGAFGGIAQAYDNMGQRDKELEARERVLTLREALVSAHPEVPEYRSLLAKNMNSTAWLYDPEREWVLLSRAVELTERKDGNSLDSLAGVLARNGRYEEAAQIQREALEQLDPTDLPEANDPAFRKGFEDRLREYESKAWQQEPSP